MPAPPDTTPRPSADLPPLQGDEAALLHRALARIGAAIAAAGGALPFDRYMELALYGAGIGYYVNGSRKFGAGGDFVTAPEISPLFAQCLARQCAELLQRLGGGEVLEFGAGSGVMAVDLLLELQRLDSLPGRYRILELSADLQQRQRALLQRRAPGLVGRVEWCSRLPEPGWRGVALGNEVLDAMPVQRFRSTPGGTEEQCVVVRDGRLASAWRPAATPGLAAAVQGLQAQLGPLAPGYVSEINLRLGPWLRALGAVLAAGALLLVDYGYSRAEYYHPERRDGTLICHFRQRAHADPLLLPGLQDITANVDFSAVAAAGAAAGFSLAGYATQAHFLLGCGLDALLAASDPERVGAHLDLVQGAKQLTLPGAMGERFKAIGLLRGLEGPLRGFAVRDLRGRL